MRKNSEDVNMSELLSLALGRSTLQSAAAEGHTQNDSVRGANPQVQFHVITNTEKVYTISTTSDLIVLICTTLK